MKEIKYLITYDSKKTQYKQIYNLKIDQHLVDIGGEHIEDGG